MNSEKKGRDLLASVVGQIKELDARILPFDSDKVDELEQAVSQAVRDIFGEDSPRYLEFEDFRIATGPVSLGDSRTEKQAKFEIGLPQAVARLEALLESMEEKGPGEKPEGAVQRPPGKTQAAPPPRKKPLPPPTAAKTERRAAAPVETAAVREGPPRARPKQPGKVLILQAGGDDISLAVTALMDKIGVDVLLLEEDTPSSVEEAASKGDLAFTLMCVSSFQKGGLSGLTAVISKPRPKHEVAFKLGLLVGKLGPGKVAILYGGEKLLDIPETLFGIRYLPFQEGGGWQIGLLKLLKENGFTVDANLLFD